MNSTGGKPPFDPNQPYTATDTGKPYFDPSQPFDVVDEKKKSKQSVVNSGVGSPVGANPTSQSESTSASALEPSPFESARTEIKRILTNTKPLPQGVTPEMQLGVVMQGLSPEDQIKAKDFTDKFKKYAPDIAILGQQVNENPEDTRALNLLGQRYADMGDDATALNFFSNSNSKKDNVEALKGIARIYTKQGNNEQAKQAWIDVQKKKPNDSESALNLARIYTAEGNIEESDKQAAGIEHPYAYNLKALNAEKRGDKSGAKINKAAADSLTWEARMNQQTEQSYREQHPELTDQAEAAGVQNTQPPFEKSNIAETLSYPFTKFAEAETGALHSFAEGIRQITEAGKQSPSSFSEYVSHTLKGVNGIVTAGFSGLMLAAPMVNTAFNMLPDKAKDILFEPINTLADLTPEEVASMSQNKQAGLSLLNNVASLAMMAGVHKGAKDRFSADKVVAPSEAVADNAARNSLKKTLGDVTLNEVQKTQDINARIPDTVKDPDKRVAIASLLSKKDALVAAKEKMDESFHPSMDEKIAEVDKQIQDESGYRAPVKETKTKQTSAAAKPVTEKAAEPSVQTEEVLPADKQKVAGVTVEKPTEEKSVEYKSERSKPEWTQSEVAKLTEKDAIDVNEIKKKDEAGEDFAIVTGSNPEGKALSEADNAALQVKAAEWLKEHGYEPKAVVGRYEGLGEQSFFVDGMSLKDAQEFRKEFNQESVLHQKGMVYEDSFVPRAFDKESGQDFAKGDFTPETDFATMAKQPDGSVKSFSLGFKWGEKKPIAEIEQALTEQKTELANRESVKIKAKQIADRVRSLKTDASSFKRTDKAYGVVFPFLPEVYNGAIELAAKAIEAGGSVVEAVQKAIDHMKDSDWYKGLSSEHKIQAENKLREDVAKQEFLTEELPEPSNKEQDTRKFIETVEGSNKTTEEMKSKVAELDKFYDVIHNQDAIKAADTKINKDLSKAKEEVLSDSAPNEVKSALAIRLMKHYERIKDIDSALEIFNSYEKQLRDAGRFIQAASLWDKLSPRAFLKSALNQAKALGKDLPLEVQRNILEKMTEIGEMPEGAEKTKKTLEVLNYIADQLPHSTVELLDAYRYQNMLSNPRTHLRNVYSNAFNTLISRPADMFMKAGYDLFRHPFNPAARDMKFSNIPKYYKDVFSAIPRAVAGFSEAFANGYISDKILDLKDTDTQIAALRRANLPKALTAIPRFMEAQDNFFSTLIGSGEKARLMSQGMSESEAGIQAKKLAENYLYRSKLGDKEYMKNAPILARSLDSLGQWVMKGRKLPVLGTALKWFIPFITTPINVAKLGVERSPLGFIGGNYSREQIARATVGSMITVTGAMLAAQDRTTWAAPSDPREKELFYASGRKPYSIKIGNKWIPMQYLGLYGIAMAIPAAIKHYAQDEKHALSDGDIKHVVDAALSTSGFIANQSPLAGVDAFSKLAGGEIDEAQYKSLGFATEQFLPLQGFVRYINTILDPVYRKSHGYVESIEKDLPILSKELEPHTTLTGEPAKRESFNYYLPYDVGLSIEELDLPLEQRRKLLQIREKAKQGSEPITSPEPSQGYTPNFH